MPLPPVVFSRLRWRSLPLLWTALLLSLLGNLALADQGGAWPPLQPGEAPSEDSPASPQAIQRPLLKWLHGGCYPNWCETAWYASPAAADLDGDGTVEIVGAAYSVFIVDGATGALERRIDPPGERVWPGVVVADLERDGNLEIVTAHEEGYVHVFNWRGDILWSRQPTPGYELRSLAVADLEMDGNLEIIVASKRGVDQWWVYEHDGRLRPGQWPQHGEDSDENGYADGCLNENIAVGDLNGDGRAEIIGSNDTHWLNVYHEDGSQARANPIYGARRDGTPKYWSAVGVHVDHAADLRGYANCETERRPNLAYSAPAVADVNGDGSLETIVIGNVYICGIDPYIDLYEMPFIFNADRTRWSGLSSQGAAVYDWTVIPQPDDHAAPLIQDYNVMKLHMPNAVTADLDGNGDLEILYASYDGRLHAFWLDKTEHGNWPYSVYRQQEGFYRFASEPAVADLDNDGRAEVIFTSWAPVGSQRTGKLHLLDYLGRPLFEIDLPPYYGDTDWNGSLPAPTLANVDGDPDLEVVLNTAHSGLVVYDLPGTAGARLLWGTGRGSYLRNGAPTPRKLNLPPAVFLPLLSK